MADDINYLDRNEFNFEPSPEVVKALKDFDVNKLCFYTRLYDEGKKSIFSIALAEDYGVDESQVVLGNILGGIISRSRTRSTGAHCNIPSMRRKMVSLTTSKHCAAASRSISRK